MKSRFALLTLLFSLVAASSLRGAEAFLTNKLQALALVQGLKYQRGDIDLDHGLARLNVPPEFKFLDHTEAEKVLVKIWHNPGSSHTLGLLLPSDKGPLDPDCWAVAISYAADGYVKDNDAAKINYDDLLKQMQKAAREASKERIRRGYPGVELVGWATPPHYEPQTHKMYWAKELKFGGETESTLNYNIRMLGRRGVLVVNVVAAMDQLPEIEQRTPEILGMINFNEGHRYADFDPKVDRVATYGLAALVAGGVAVKFGLFKMLWVFLLGAKKLVIIAVAMIAAWFRRLFGRNKTTPST